MGDICKGLTLNKKTWNFPSFRPEKHKGLFRMLTCPHGVDRALWLQLCGAGLWNPQCRAGATFSATPDTRLPKRSAGGGGHAEALILDEWCVVCFRIHSDRIRPILNVWLDCTPFFWSLRGLNDWKELARPCPIFQTQMRSCWFSSHSLRLLSWGLSWWSAATEVLHPGTTNIPSPEKFHPYDPLFSPQIPLFFLKRTSNPTLSSLLPPFFGSLLGSCDSPKTSPCGQGSYFERVFSFGLWYPLTELPTPPKATNNPPGVTSRGRAAMVVDSARAILHAGVHQPRGRRLWPGAQQRCSPGLRMRAVSSKSQLRSKAHNICCSLVKMVYIHQTLLFHFEPSPALWKEKYF